MRPPRKSRFLRPDFYDTPREESKYVIKNDVVRAFRERSLSRQRELSRNRSTESFTNGLTGVDYVRSKTCSLADRADGSCGPRDYKRTISEDDRRTGRDYEIPRTSGRRSALLGTGMAKLTGRNDVENADGPKRNSIVLSGNAKFELSRSGSAARNDSELEEFNKSKRKSLILQNELENTIRKTQNMNSKLSGLMVALNDTESHYEKKLERLYGCRAEKPAINGEVGSPVEEKVPSKAEPVADPENRRLPTKAESSAELCNRRLSLKTEPSAALGNRRLSSKTESASEPENRRLSSKAEPADQPEARRLSSKAESAVEPENRRLSSKAESAAEPANRLPLKSGSAADLRNRRLSSKTKSVAEQENRRLPSKAESTAKQENRRLSSKVESATEPEDRKPSLLEKKYAYFRKLQNKEDEVSEKAEMPKESTNVVALTDSNSGSLENDTSSLTSPPPEEADSDAWSVLSDNADSQYSDNVNDRIRRRSFYSRFNLSSQRSASNIAGSTKPSSYSRSMSADYKHRSNSNGSHPE